MTFFVFVHILLDFHLPYGSGALLADLLPKDPSPGNALALRGCRFEGSPGLYESLRLLLMRDPEPLTWLLAPFVAVALGGCLKPDGGRFDPSDGDGEDWDDLMPLTVDCRDGGGGRFIFCCGSAGREDTAVAIA